MMRAVAGSARSCVSFFRNRPSIGTEAEGPTSATQLRVGSESGLSFRARRPQKGRSAGLLHLSRNLVAFFHESLICGTLLQAVHVPLKSGVRFESLHHHPEGNLRPDVDVGSTELRTENVWARHEGLSERCDGVVIAAVTQRTWPGGCRARQHAINHRGLDATPTEEQPPVVSPARGAVCGWCKARGRKGIREVRANGPALGHH